MSRLFTFISILTTFCLFTGAAFAHHSTVALFDGDQTIEVTGVIEQVSWRNPHGYILFRVEDEAGASRLWRAETISYSVMINRGIDGDEIKVGDTITMAGAPSKLDRP